MMPTINSIIEEIKEIPIDRLEDLYSLIHSFNSTKVIAQDNKEKILAFAGVLNDLSDKDYKDFENNIKSTREGLFNRKVTL